MTADTPRLRSLSPTYSPDQHKDYVEVLTAELTKSGSDAPRNVALTGHYGSGKSSVLAKTQQVLAKSLSVINLSLSSLGIGDGRIPEDGNRALDKTNLIQKEIVKQLLYRRKPSSMPASRYSRLDIFNTRRALWSAAGFGVAMTGLALLAKVPNKVQDALPAQAWTWTNDHLWGNLAGPIQWSSLLIVFALSVLTAVWAQRLLQQRIRVTELAAGPTKLTLSDASSSYFDEYLDEIVYFFQTSETTVVIFEDLDRFKDPHIFETLRELNLLLNNAEQTGDNPIRFVYAIRDSIFEQLDDGIGEESGDADSGETRRLMSTNRTKFFDLVIPMVPFISHRTSRDLIHQELQSIVPEQRPGNKVVDIVGAHLTDMRLIKNICNEYEVFCRKILASGGLDELTPDRLFASIVYKNLYLADYEKIRDGTSRLDTLYGAYRGWVTQQTAVARAVERTARRRLRRLDAIGSRAAQLGARLQEVLLARYLANVNLNHLQVTVAGSTYPWADVPTGAFWRAYLNDRGDLLVHYRQGYQPESLPFDKVQTLMGYRLSPDDWTSEIKDEINSEIATAVANQQLVQHSSLTEALSEVDRLFTYDGEELTVNNVAERLFDDADLVLELLRFGLLDENFTLYVTQFPGQAISASAMNFIIKAVQPNEMDIEYHFGATDEVDVDDIRAVLDAEQARLLGGRSIYNIELFDYLLAEAPDKLKDPIRRLVTAAASDQTFIDAYLTSGTSAGALAKGLSASWPGIFSYLLEQDADARSLDLLDAALGGVQLGVTYTLSSSQRAALCDALPSLSTITMPQPEERANAIAATLEQMGIYLEDLSNAAEPLRGRLVTRNLYPVTLTNLRAIVESDEGLPLDQLKTTRQEGVYEYVLSHIVDYLAAMEAAPDTATIASTDHFAEVLAEVGEADIDAVEEVARRATAECMLTDLDDIDSPLWPALAAAHRLTLTAQNVAAYIGEHGVDADLANWLTSAPAISLPSGDSTPLTALAVSILNATALGDDAKLRLVASLHLEPGSIATADLQKDAHTTVPALVQSGLASDNADVYVNLGDDEWAIKEELIKVSDEFPNYVTKLSLSANDLYWISSSDLPDEAKDALLSNLETFRSELGPKGAAELAKWAVQHGRLLAADAIVTLATKGGSRSARPVVKLLGDQASTIELELMKEALNAVGEPYSQLTAPGRDRPKVAPSDGLVSVLTRLRTAGIVSKFEEKKGRLEVSKRHS